MIRIGDLKGFSDSQVTSPTSLPSSYGHVPYLPTVFLWSRPLSSYCSMVTHPITLSPRLLFPAPVSLQTNYCFLPVVASPIILRIRYDISATDIHFAAIMCSASTARSLLRTKTVPLYHSTKSLGHGQY
eukprot:1846368-Rhodomonas_salina.1